MAVDRLFSRKKSSAEEDEDGSPTLDDADQQPGNRLIAVRLRRTHRELTATSRPTTAAMSG